MPPQAKRASNTGNRRASGSVAKSPKTKPKPKPGRLRPHRAIARPGQSQASVRASWPTVAANSWIGVSEQQKRYMHDHLNDIKARLNEAMNAHIEHLPPHFLTLLLDAADWNQMRWPAAGLGAAASAVCFLAPKKAQQMLQQAEAIIELALDFFDSKSGSSALLIFYGVALYHLYTSTWSLEELYSASGNDAVATTLNIEFHRLRTDVNELLSWWSGLSRRERILIQNVDKFIERVDLVAKDIRQAQVVLLRRQRDLARQMNESTFLEVAGIVGFIGFGGVLLTSPQIVHAAVLSGKAIGTVLAGGTMVGGMMMSKWYQARLTRCVNNLHKLNNDLGKLATKLSVRHSTLVAILTAPAL